MQLGRSIRTERYRYAQWGEERDEELYDLVDDPLEYTSLADDPALASVRDEMRRKLEKAEERAQPQ